MPILSAETPLFPENLLDGDDFAGDNHAVDPSGLEPADRKWYVVYTKARQEKSLARELLQQQVPFYLPQVEKVSMRRGRKVRSHIPLFTGYVFLHGSEEERVASLKTNRISAILPVEDQETLRSELSQIHQLIESGAALTVEARIEAGQEVRVIHGHLAGLEGLVIRRCRQTRLIVAVNMLQQGVSLEIDDCMLEPIG